MSIYKRLFLGFTICVVLFSHTLGFAQMLPSFSTTLQNAVATATANGTAQGVLGYATIGITVIPASSWDGTITFEISDDGTTFTSVLCVNRATGGTATTYANTTTRATFACPVSGSKSFRARISGRTTGSVTVTANTVEAPLASIGSSIIAGGGDALTAQPLSQFAATTSAQLAGVISNETGTGALVFAGSPALTGVPTVTLNGGDGNPNLEILSLNRSGGTPVSGARAVWLTWHDTDNATYLGAIAASRMAPDATFTGDLIFYTNVSSASTTLAGLHESMRIAGSGAVTIGDLATAGAATGKTVVCADTAGKLYRSSSGVACAN